MVLSKYEMMDHLYFLGLLLLIQVRCFVSTVYIYQQRAKNCETVVLVIGKLRSQEETHKLEEEKILPYFCVILTLTSMLLLDTFSFKTKKRRKKPLL